VLVGLWVVSDDANYAFIHQPCGTTFNFVYIVSRLTSVINISHSKLVNHLLTSALFFHSLHIVVLGLLLYVMFQTGVRPTAVT